MYRLDVPVYKKVSYPKQRSLLVLHIFILPGLLTQVFTRSGNSLPEFLPEIVPDSLPESLPRTLLESIPKSYPSVLPRALFESYLDTYPIGLTQPYPSAYQAG
jgi:hypothetical protein